ncbi:CvpA family protein [Lentilactobacillus kribbianus]|uniref:CvpA family protein n=1 Tax=Lentilactobacillus kribbianus TaxID=2729622 RepID=UPI0015540FFA|nr:CvpA family protein [Lentilactobacillus kribbianus]
MIINILILVVLALAIRRGMQVGLVIELLNLVGYLVALVGGIFLSHPINIAIQHWLDTQSNLQQPLLNFFLRNIMFFVVFGLIWQVFRLIKQVIIPVTKLPVINTVNGLLGGAVNFVIVYLVIFVLLFIFAQMPIETWQAAIRHSEVAQFILDKTPQIFRYGLNHLANYGGDIYL